jgi:hypothetical protein
MIVVSFSSCATVLGGRVTEYQRKKPADGDLARKIRGVALVADILLFWPGAIVDFATGAIYQPEKQTASGKPMVTEAKK